jgi:hypothetical protein
MDKLLFKVLKAANFCPLAGTQSISMISIYPQDIWIDREYGFGPEKIMFAVLC